MPATTDSQLVSTSASTLSKPMKPKKDPATKKSSKKRPREKKFVDDDDDDDVDVDDDVFAVDEDSDASNGTLEDGAKDHQVTIQAGRPILWPML